MSTVTVTTYGKLRLFFSIGMMLAIVSVIALPVLAVPSQEGNVVHVVHPGETLYSIARRYGVSVASISSVNGIVNPNLIYVGQRLLIPTYATGSPSGQIIHVVQPGETLFSIALRYGLDPWTIGYANGLTNLNYIFVGQRLVIPKTTAPQPQPTIAPRPTSMPISWPGPWRGEYFDNDTLNGSAYVTRDDAQINFDWNSGPPAGGMPVNAFSVRWVGTFPFEAGTYRFYARVDDGVRLYVDGELVIDGWRDGALRLYSADRAMTAGDHEVKVEYYDRIQVAGVHVWWKQISTAVTATATPAATLSPGATATPAPTGVWFGQFFNNETLEGEPVLTHYVPAIEFNWGTHSPDPAVWWDGFSARWVRTIQLNTDHYRFCTMSDDGVRIWVGDDLVTDEWHANDGSIPHCDTYWAKTGTYEVTVEYYEHGGDAMIYVWWEPH